MTLHDVRPAPCFEPRSAGNLTGITTSGGTLRVGRACRSQTLYQFESVLKLSCLEKLLRPDIRLYFRFMELAWVKIIVLSSNRMGGQNLPPHSNSTPLHLQKTNFLNILNQPPL